MPVSQKCIVPYCFHRKKINNCVFATFPRDLNRCRDWLKVLGVEDLLYLSNDFLSKSRYVCGCHFKDNDFGGSKKRLKHQAVPCVIDKRIVPLSVDAVMQFPITDPTVLQTEAIQVRFSELMKGSEKNIVKMQKNNFLQPSENSEHQHQVESMSIDSNGSNYCPKRSSSAEERPLTAVLPISAEVTSLETSAKTPKQKKLRLSVAVRRKSLKKVAEDLGVTSSTLSSSEKKAFKEIQKLQHTVKRLTSKLKEKTKECQSLAEQNHDITKNLPSIIKSPMLREVVLMGLINQDRKPCGRRYTDDQKVISTHIERLGPKCYKFLNDKLELPSSRTNKKISKVFPLELGENDKLLVAVKKILQDSI